MKAISEKKICSMCRITKSVKDFYKSKKTIDGLISECKKCCRKRSDRAAKERPWRNFGYKAKGRCNNKNTKSFKYYGAVGIKYKLTTPEIKGMWFRDKAYLMKKPSIDRINPKGDYELSNCRFLELSENSRIGSLGNHRKLGKYKAVVTPSALAARRLTARKRLKEMMR